MKSNALHNNDLLDERARSAGRPLNRLNATLDREQQRCRRRVTPSQRAAEILTPDEVILILRLKDVAPRNPREALRSLVRRGRLQCLRIGPRRNGRMLFLRRHINQCLTRMEQWGRSQPIKPKSAPAAVATPAG